MCVNFESINRRLSISEMASMHDISRQTLIYYDKIGLFEPEIVDEDNGYRYYSTLQIPLLREICFLRSIGMPLEEIRKNNKYNNSQTTIELLESQGAKIEKEIEKLKKQREMISKRVDTYRNATEYANDSYKPFIEYYPERKVIYQKWNPDDRTKHGLHYTLMRIWNMIDAHGMLPGHRWGALLFAEDVRDGDPLRNAGGCCFIDSDVLPKDITAEEIHTLPAGEYACIPKFGMPYEIEHIYKLLHWIEENGYEMCGDIYDECLMDSIFYDDDTELDFCEIQIPIRKKLQEG